jgi:hypothetical protein
VTEQFPPQLVLPDDGIYREVTFHGAISADPSGVNEFRCAVYFATLHTKSDSEPGDYNGLGRTYQIGTGSLPTVPIGAIFKGRQKVSLRPTFSKATEVFDPRMPSDEPLGVAMPFHSPSRGPGDPLDFVPVGEDAVFSRIYRMGLLPSAKVRCFGDVIVPVMALIRYLWGPTTETNKRVFDGLLGIHNNPRESIFDPNSLKIVSRSKLRVHGFRRPTPGEMLVAARMASDEHLRHAYFSVSNRLRQDGLFQRPVHASMAFPFIRPAKWTYEWRWIGISDENLPGGGRPHHFITRILDIDFRQPIRDVIWSVPAQVVSAGRSKKHIASKRRNAPRKKKKVTQTASSTEPSQTLGRVNIVLEPQMVDLPFRWQVKGRVAKEGQAYQVVKNVAPTTVSAVGSTADGIWRPGNVVPVSYRDRRDMQRSSRIPDTRPVPTRLAQLIDALRALEKRKCAVEILHEDFTDKSNPLWHFPARAGMRKLSWSTISSFTGLPRRALVAVVERGQWKYLCIESEMRDASDFHTLCVFRLDLSRRIKDETIRQFLSAVARAEGVWRNIRSTYVVRGRTHNQDWSATEFAARILKTLQSFDQEPEME